MVLLILIFSTLPASLLIKRYYIANLYRFFKEDYNAAYKIIDYILHTKAQTNTERTGKYGKAP